MCQCRFLYNRRVRKLLLCMQAVERNGVHRDYLNCTLQMNSFTGWTPPSAVSRCLNLLSVQKSAFCPLVEKLWIGSKNGWHPLCRARRALPPCKVWGGEIEQRAQAVGAKMWCLYVCLFFLTLRGRRAVRSTGVDYTLSRFCVAVCGSTLKQLRTVTTTVCDCCCIISM